VDRQALPGIKELDEQARVRTEKPGKLRAQPTLRVSAHSRVEERSVI
jgi:hypothetical protein